MKPFSRNTSLLSLSSIFLSCAGLSLDSAWATTLYWDTNGTTTGSGAATGTWDSSTANWTTDATGLSATSAFTTSILDNLFFSAGTNGTIGTVTVSGTQAANSITFDDPVAQTLSGGTGITLGGGSGAGIFQTGVGTVTNTISTALTLNGAQAWTNSSSGSTLAISGTVTRNTGASVNFTPTGTINLTGSGLANDASGILGGWATVGNAGTAGASGDFAALDGSGNVITYSGYTNITTATNGAGATTQNWKTTNAAASLTASATVNSLVMTTDFNIQSGATMTLGSGGLILSGASRWLKNNGAGSIAGTGQITSGLASGELFVDSSASGGTGDNDWQIWTKIVNNGGTAVKLVKNGPGYLKLDNANTYTGGTIMNGGVLVAGRVDSLGTGAVQVNSGSVTVDNQQNANGDLNNNFSGGGTVTIQNTGTANMSVNLNGDWSGFTGTLNYNPTTKTMNLNSAASMDLSHAAVVFSSANSASSFRTSGTGTTKFGSLASGSGNFNLFVNGATEIGNLGTNTIFGGVISQAGSITKVGSGTLILSGANTYTGATTVSGGTLQMNSTNATSASVTVNSGGTLALNVGDALGTTTSKNVPTINSGGIITNITSAARVTLWNGLTMTGGTLTSTSTGDANGAYSLSGSVIATSDASGNAATISGSPISLQNQNVANGAITFNVTRGSATPASDLNVSANLIASSSAANIAVAKTGAGIMTLSGANTYTGGTAINGGTLALGSSGAIGTTGTISFGGGTLQHGASNTTDYSSRFSTAASQAYSVDTNGQNVTWATALTSSGGSLAKSGSGTLILTGNNTHTGATTVSSGTLQLGNADAVKNSTMTISTTNGLAFGAGIGTFNLGGLSGASSQTLTDTGSNAVTLSVGANNASTTYSGVLSGIGAVAKVGTGALTLSNANTYSGGTTLNAGTLAFGNNAAFGTGAVTLNGGTLKAGGNNNTLGNNFSVGGASVLDMAANNTTLNGNLSGSAALTLNNSSFAATLGLGGNNSGYTGTITFNNNNAVSFNSVNAGSSGAAWVFNDTTVDRVRINIGTGTINFGSISGGGQIQNDTASSTATASVGALGTDTTFSGTMRDSGTGILALAKVGSGALTLSGTSTYTGATAVQLGKLVVSGFIGNSVVSVTGTNTTLASGNTGTIGSSVTVNNGAILAAGDVNAIGTATVGSGGTTMNAGSIFSWDLDTAGSVHDKVVTSSLAGDSGGASAVFAVVLKSGQSFTDTFWNSDHSWDNIFSTTGLAADALGMSSVFSSFVYNGSGTTPVSGSFSFTGTGGNTLTWSAVPEPTSALASLLICAGMFRRRRH